MFKKTCYECGAKVDTLYEAKCEKCHREGNPPIADIKPIKIKYCNSCKKVFYSHQLISVKELKDRLPDIVKKHLTIDKSYDLEKIEIQDFQIMGSKISFDIEIDAKLRK